MLNVKTRVDLGYDSETGKYIFAIISEDGKQWMSYDVTDLIKSVINYENELKNGQSNVENIERDIKKDTKEPEAKVKRQIGFSIE